MKKAIIHQHYPLDYAGEEALNSICTNLAFIGTDKRKIVITSNSQSEGKSWMTMHIAENMARRGRHVVLVDADMRRSFMVQRWLPSPLRSRQRKSPSLTVPMYWPVREITGMAV